jgi:hypothetical protein
VYLHLPRGHLFVVAHHSSSLRRNSLLLALAGSLVPCALGVHLLLEHVLALLLGLGTVDLKKHEMSVSARYSLSRKLDAPFLRRVSQGGSTYVLN